MPTIEKLIVELRAENRDLKNKLNQSGNSVDSFGSKVDKIGGLIAGAFAVDRIVSFGSELVKLGNTASGVQIAFNNLADVSIQDLRDATQGAVSDFDLMQAAVKAENFKIPLEQLGTFFEFATNRAKATGESVDFLVESIINGIGRKSTLVLDNLGISASELQKEIKLTGDFGKAAGNIIAREMENTDQAIKDTVDTVGQFNASWQNLRLTLSDLVSEEGSATLGLITDIIKGFDDFVARRYDLNYEAIKDNIKDVNEQIATQNRLLGDETFSQRLYRLFAMPESFGDLINPTIGDPRDREQLEERLLQLQQKRIELFNQQILQSQKQQKLKEEQAALEKAASEEAARQEAIQQKINETGKESLLDLQEKLAIQEFLNQEMEDQIELQAKLAEIEPMGAVGTGPAFMGAVGSGPTLDGIEDMNAGLDETVAKMQSAAMVTGVFGSLLEQALSGGIENVGDLISILGSLIAKLATAATLSAIFEGITNPAKLAAGLAIAGTAVAVIGSLISNAQSDSKIRSGDIATSNRFATSGAGSRTSTTG